MLFYRIKILWDVLIDTRSRSGEYYCYTVLCITLDYASEILVSLSDYYGSDSGSYFYLLIYNDIYSGTSNVYHSCL